MPVTINIGPHHASKFGKEPFPNDATEFFEDIDCDIVLASNFKPDANLLYRRNGFVQTVIESYSKHYNLVIRPDDVWIAIVCQLSFYINANSEDLRAKFVAHEGKKTLVLNLPERSMDDIDWDSALDRMTDLVVENLVDKSLKNWIIPAFSTTTRHDRTVAAVLMEASLKCYFEYIYKMRCGIPSVTLEGTKQDWVEIGNRLSKLDTWGDSTQAWHKLLEPIVRRFVLAFDGDVDEDFWGHIASPIYRGSGSGLGGWITAFCAFTDEGKFQGDAHVFSVERYLLDGVLYPIIGMDDIPSGGAEAPIKIDTGTGVLIPAAHGAGILGTVVTPGASGEGDTVQSFPIWYFCLRKDGENT